MIKDSKKFEYIYSNSTHGYSHEFFELTLTYTLTSNIYVSQTVAERNSNDNSKKERHWAFVASHIHVYCLIQGRIRKKSTGTLSSIEILLDVQT